MAPAAHTLEAHGRGRLLPAIDILPRRQPVPIEVRPQPSAAPAADVYGWQLSRSMAFDRKPWIASIEVRPHVGAAASATCADEPRLDIGQPHRVRPAVSIQGNVTAVAVDQDAAHAHAAHFAEGDFERPAICMSGCVAFSGEACRDQSGIASTSQIIDP